MPLPFDIGFAETASWLFAFVCLSSLLYAFFQHVLVPFSPFFLGKFVFEPAIIAFAWKGNYHVEHSWFSISVRCCMVRDHFRLPNSVYCSHPQQFYDTVLGIHSYVMLSWSTEQVKKQKPSRQQEEELLFKREILLTKKEFRRRNATLSLWAN